MVDGFINAIGAKLIQVTRSALNGGGNIGAFIGKFVGIIKTGVVQIFLMAAGKVKPLDIAKQIVDRVKEIHAFAHDLLTGKLSLPQALARARQFGSHLLTVYNQALKDVAIARGKKQALRRLSPGYAHCAQCLLYATAPNWVAIDKAIPAGIGCDCRGNCKCLVFYR
jgi:hypothetical protein